jgi:3',5'-cyclic AMP phosphodiesterase CpdA
MLLAQISDTHITLPDDNTQNSEKKIRSLRQCVDDINSLADPPDVVIHTGDLSQNGTFDELMLVKRILDKLAVPYHVTPGNKDSKGVLLDVFSEQFLGISYEQPVICSIDDFPIRLVSVDTTSSANNLGVLDCQRMLALDKILNEAVKCPTILFLHHPPFDVSDNNSPRIEYKSRDSIRRFSDVVDQHPQIVALFCGHLHWPLRKTLGHFDASVVPPVCGALNYSKKSNGLSQEGVFHLHAFDDANKFSTQEIKVSH